MIDFVLLDLDNTLLDFDRAEASALGRVLGRLGLPSGADTIALYSAINDRQWKRLERGEIDRAQVGRQRFAELFAALGSNADAEAANALYMELLSEGHFFIPGAQELLETLLPRCAMYLVTNGTAWVQQRRIADAGLGKYFRGVFISQQMGADKPSAEYFERCFAQIPGFARERAVIVGDSLTSDILGGINAGIHTCLFDPTGAARRDGIVPEHRIAALGELPALLERM